MPKIKAVLFDMDGVLIEAKDWHYEALNQALSLFGYEISRYEHLTAYDGLPTRVKLEKLTLEKGLPKSLHSFINEMKQQYTVSMIQTKCRPRFAHEYALSRLKAEGYKMAVGSNSVRMTLELMMHNARLTRYFEFMLSNEDVAKAKPSPEIYSTAMKRLGLDPDECLIVEDNENGIKAAIGSGGHLMQVATVDDVTYEGIKKRIAEIEKRGIAVQVMFLMGGAGLAQDEASYPLYLTELNGTLILERQVDYCRQLGSCQFLFCLKTVDSKAFQVDSVIKQLDEKALIVPVPGKTRGAVCTALLAISHLDVSDELLLLAVNDLVDVPCGEIVDWFRSNNADAGVVAFHSVHPRYSFAKVDASGSVCEFAEKNPISRNALASLYYFKKAGDFIECSKELIRKDNPVKGAFYVSQALNEMILLQKKVLVYQIPNSAFHPLKTEAQLANYLYELQEAKISK